MANVVCYGEVLWDMFPNHKKIGGAPLNVAMRLHSFGQSVSIISAVGQDENGKKLLSHIEDRGLDTNCIRVLKAYKTGEVAVSLNAKGSATYEILHPRAWDKIENSTSIIEVVKKSDAFIYGSLASRDEISRSTLFELLESASFKICDLNLRPPHYNIKTLKYLMEKANFIKFNDEELYEISKLLDSPFKNLEQNMFYIAKQTHTDTLCVTKGEHGATLLYNKNLYYNSGYAVKVVDTVGAGDSFLGTLISELLDNKNPQLAINKACAVGALVAESDGANPKFTEALINDFMKIE